MALFRILLWVLCAAPMADLVWRTFVSGLGPNPQETLLRETGTWCLVLLLVTLGVTPMRSVLQWGELIRVRRMLGLWTFAWAVVHLLCFWAFEHDFIWANVFLDGLKRPFVTLGLLAFAILSLLAATSHQWAMRTLGSRWKKLHRLVYLAAIAACVHFVLHRAGKNNFTDPAIAGSIFLGLMLLRSRWLRWQPGRSRGIEKV
jgi:sulfoxide reductase heme-binding subunit YedZ